MSHPRNPKNWCSCGAHIRNSRSGYCRICWIKNSTDEFGKNNFINSFTSTYERHKYQNVRCHAHRVVEGLGRAKVCFSCGYKNYVELCHIRPISTFDQSTSLYEVNSPDNLVYLCPNHHWELDNGLLKLT